MIRAGRDEAEAAYFTLLRARAEVEGLARYGDYLNAERRRLVALVEDAGALLAAVDPRLRRPLLHTDAALADVVRARTGVIDDELRKLEARNAAAEAFVSECEQEVARLRVG